MSVCFVCCFSSFGFDEIRANEIKMKIKENPKQKKIVEYLSEDRHREGEWKRHRQEYPRKKTQWHIGIYIKKKL